MKALFVVCILAISASSLAHPHISLEDLEGVWSGPVDPLFIFIFTEQGPGIICRDQLTPECMKEIPESVETGVIENNTIASNVTRFIGASTPEKSAELYPACAASGVLPQETMDAIPASEIIEFDPKTGRFVFIDSRSPDEENCIFVTLNRRKTGPSLTLQYTISDEGTVESSRETGANFVCEREPGLCKAEANENGLSVMISIDYELPCVGGACSYTTPPLSGSKSHFISSKKVKG